MPPVTSPPADGAFAVVTGASYGLGVCFAEALAARGYHLLLTARSQDRLDALAARLRLAHPGRDIRIVAADLGANGCRDVVAAATGLQVDLLVNNAGLGSHGEFDRLEPAREAEIVTVNVTALVGLTHAFLPAMRARNAGAVLNVASIAAFRPVPYLATYAASKAFVLSFSLALYAENRRQGVHVMALCPGPTRTHFFEAAGTRPRMAMQSPEDVVRLGLRGLDARRPVLVCGGWKKRLMICAAPFVPRSWVLAIAARVGRRLGTTE